MIPPLKGKSNITAVHDIDGETLRLKPLTQAGGKPLLVFDHQ